ncbi:MAG: SDR family oxidoreductase [Myxococcales bacterium]|nr:SDR family oxidoreductase [Myxococcales bacterium]
MGYAKDKVVLITGASAGIGEALALEFAKQGAVLVLTARREDRLQEVSQKIQALGQKALPIACDVTKEEELAQATQKAIETFGRIDIVVANAGFGVAGTFERLTTEDYQRQFDTNVFGVMHTLKATLEPLKQSKGSFAVVGSVNSYISLPGNSPYGMSKFAVRAFAQSMQGELKPYGISVTLIAPGFVASEIRRVNNKGVFKQEAKDPVPPWLIMPAEPAARQIAKAIHKRKREAVITGHGKIIVFLQRHFPWLVSSIVSRFAVKARSEPK